MVKLPPGIITISSSNCCAIVSLKYWVSLVSCLINFPRRLTVGVVY